MPLQFQMNTNQIQLWGVRGGGAAIAETKHIHACMHAIITIVFYNGRQYFGVRADRVCDFDTQKPHTATLSKINYEM